MISFAFSFYSLHAFLANSIASPIHILHPLLMFFMSHWHSRIRKWSGWSGCFFSFLTTFWNKRCSRSSSHHYFLPLSGPFKNWNLFKTGNLSNKRFVETTFFPKMATSVNRRWWWQPPTTLCYHKRTVQLPHTGYEIYQERMGKKRSFISNCNQWMDKTNHDKWPLHAGVG